MANSSGTKAGWSAFQALYFRQKKKAHAGVVGIEFTYDDMKQLKQMLLCHTKRRQPHRLHSKTFEVSAVPPNICRQVLAHVTTAAAGGNSEQETDEQQQATERWQIEDLDKALQHHLHPLLKLGCSNTD